MKIQYLGTGAAEAIPGVFCQCDICRKARELGGKDLRRRSSSVVNGNLLIDLPPDIYCMSLQRGVDLSQIYDIIITHAHEDHLYETELGNIVAPYAHRQGIVRLFGSETVIGKIRAMHGHDLDAALQCTEIKPFEPFTAAGCTVTAFPAHHGGGVSLNYSIECGGKALLYLHDTGLPREETWRWLEGRHYDLVSMDGTKGDHENYDSHMNNAEIVGVKQRLIEMGSADTRTVFVANHFSHNKRMLHTEIESALLPHGIQTAWDGMQIEF